MFLYTPVKVQASKCTFNAQSKYKQKSVYIHLVKYNLLDLPLLKVKVQAAKYIYIKLLVFG